MRPPLYILASIHLGPIQFDQPAWLLLAPVLWAAAAWMARSSLTGMGTAARRAALVVRLAVILLLVAAIARPSWRREGRNVTLTVVLDESRSVPLPAQALASAYLREAAAAARDGDLEATVTVAREAYVRTLPAKPSADRADTQQITDRDGTNLAEGLRLGMAVMPQDTANRVLIVSDGNETAGNLLAAAEAARAAGVPIDVLVHRYRHEREVIVERLVAPATARLGETVALRVLINATAPATGRLTLLLNGEPLDLDPDSDAVSRAVSLEAGANPIVVQVPFQRAGAQQVRAVFEPDDPADDAVAENNQQLAVTFVSGQGRVLVLAGAPEDAAPLARALAEARIEAETRDADACPASLVELGVFDAVVLANVAAYRLTQQQQEDLKHYVHDLGGGLVMIGGPDSFGAGGWIGSPLADALPVRLDPPQKRQMPRGALVLMMHSCEMPDGNYWGKQTALAAVRNLSAQDLAGIVEYAWQAGAAEWVHPLSPIGDRIAINRAINSMAYGDAPSFDAFMRLALPDLQKANAGMKHAVFISDGDPAPPSRALLQAYIDAKISVSTVAVFPHSQSPTGPECQMMQRVAQATGGNFYYINSQNIGNLPDIFIKEAQTIRRTLIWEGDPFTPAPTGVPTDAMRGVPTPVPAISGYVVTADREGLSQVALRGQENDPILAAWQYGLGRSVAFTSDAAAKWAAAWVAWPAFRQFWEQHVRWAMRPGGSADIRVTTEDRGETTLVTVEALDAAGERLNFLRFKGRVSGPGGASEEIELRQTGPGRYEGTVRTDRAGAYVLNYRYLVLVEGGPAREGSVQAAVTRPFADEFRSLQDNAALLQQVASLTGGRVISGEPAAADLWSRQGLRMPVSLRPIWLWVATVAIGLFLLDVAVRRVRIDVAGIVRAVRRGLEARRDRRAGQPLASLRAARERAQAAMARRAGDDRPAAADGGPPAVAAPAIPVAPEGERGAKFEATAEELAAARKSRPAGGPEAPPRPAAKPGPARQGSEPAPTEEGISRLLKAKKRAQDQMEQD